MITLVTGIEPLPAANRRSRRFVSTFPGWSINTRGRIAAAEATKADSRIDLAGWCRLVSSYGSIGDNRNPISQLLAQSHGARVSVDPDQQRRISDSGINGNRDGWCQPQPFHFAEPGGVAIRDTADHRSSAASPFRKGHFLAPGYGCSFAAEAWAENGDAAAGPAGDKLPVTVLRWTTGGEHQ